MLQDVRSALPDTPAEVSSAGAERASNERVIDTLLAIVVGLLGVAVVIALIGVANTLSLSVLERRRESATLRAIGLSRRQLRWMLAVEGMLIAGVGAVLGAGLGLLYGWAGAVITFGEIGDVMLVDPVDATWRCCSSSRSPRGCSPRCCRGGPPPARRPWRRSPSTEPPARTRRADRRACGRTGPSPERRGRAGPSSRRGRVGPCASPCSTPTRPAAAGSSRPTSRRTSAPPCPSCVPRSPG